MYKTMCIAFLTLNVHNVHNVHSNYCVCERYTRYTVISPVL